MTTGIEIILEAELEALNLPDAEPTPQSAQLEEVEQREYLLAMLPQIPVSEAVRLECEKEMREAEKRGWRIN